MSPPAKTSISIPDFHHHTRNLNWETTKETVKESYEGVKNVVLRNVILSISVGVVVLLLLILCCYLRRKYRRNPQIMSRRQHAQLMEERSKRRKENENNRRRKKKGRTDTPSPQEEANLVNSSFETKATILSDTNQEYKDIESDGVEMKLDYKEHKPIAGLEEKRPAKTKNTSGLRKFFVRERK